MLIIFTDHDPERRGPVKLNGGLNKIVSKSPSHNVDCSGARYRLQVNESTGLPPPFPGSGYSGRNSGQDKNPYKI